MGVSKENAKNRGALTEYDWQQIQGAEVVGKIGVKDSFATLRKFAESIDMVRAEYPLRWCLVRVAIVRWSEVSLILIVVQRDLVDVEVRHVF